MTRITITNNHQITGPISVDLPIPEAAARLVVDGLIAGLRRAGYVILDNRPAPVRLCKRCKVNPPSSSRASLCQDCQTVSLQETKRYHRQHCL